MNNLKLDTRTIVIGVVVLAVIVFLGAQLFGRPEPSTNDTFNTDSQTTGDNIQIGNVVTTSTVDMDGCALDPRTSFEPVEPVYVVAEGSDIPAGTSVFVRLYHEGSPVEDAPEITADQDYNNSCVNFIFEPSQGTAFDQGNYQAEFIINGNPANTVDFEVR